ncbi:hypothetical protein A2U01_0099249, partial [Trifolium medium]|nr:hypothetical protein [Trifolium medium]
LPGMLAAPSGVASPTPLPAPSTFLPTALPAPLSHLAFQTTTS